MKSKKNSEKVSWKAWTVPIIVALITGCFLIINTLLSNKSKSNTEPVVKEQKVDSGTINNFNAGGDIIFGDKVNNSNNGAAVKTANKQSKNESLNGSNTPPQNSMTGDNNTVIQGDNNTIIQEHR